MTNTFRQRLRSLLTALAILFAACGGDGDSNSAGQDDPARIQDYCDKCAACFKAPGFSEGFCTPFIKDDKFDSLSCTSKGDVAQLKTRTFTKGQLAQLSCPDFDYAE